MFVCATHDALNCRRCAPADGVQPDPPTHLCRGGCGKLAPPGEEVHPRCRLCKRCGKGALRYSRDILILTNPKTGLHRTCTWSAGHFM